MDSDSVLLSVVVPVYNEQASLPALMDRLHAVMGGLAVRYEILLVDDGSRDATVRWIEHYCRADRRVRGLVLSRNFGHQVALTAGLDHALGDAAITIDADLQDPPELIPDLVAAWCAGADIAYAQRTERAGESWLKRSTAAVFYRILRRLVPFELPVDSGDFRLISRRALEMLRRLPERQRYVRGLLAWVGLKQVAVPYARDARLRGESHYTWTRMIRLATTAIVSLSDWPVRFLGFLGMGLLACGAAVAGVGVVRSQSLAQAPLGLAATLIVGGIQLVALRVLGEYIGRIAEEVRGRPLYLIAARLNGPTATDSALAPQQPEPALLRGPHHPSELSLPNEPWQGATSDK